MNQIEQIIFDTTCKYPQPKQPKAIVRELAAAGYVIVERGRVERLMRCVEHVEYPVATAIIVPGDLEPLP